MLRVDGLFRFVLSLLLCTAFEFCNQNTYFQAYKMMVLLVCFMLFFLSLSLFRCEMLWLWFNAYFKSVKIWLLRFIRLPLNVRRMCAGGDAKCSLQERTKKKKWRECVLKASGFCMRNWMNGHVCVCGAQWKKLFDVRDTGLWRWNGKVIQTSLKMLFSFFEKYQSSVAIKTTLFFMHTFLPVLLLLHEGEFSCVPNALTEYSMILDFPWEQFHSFFLLFFSINSYRFRYRDLEVESSE